MNRVQHPAFQVKLLGTSSHHTSRAGLTIPMHGSIDEAAHADAVLFASVPATRELRFDRDYLARFRLDPERQLIGSMCSGALLLAALGLLDGKRATTHPITVQHLREAGVEVVDEPFLTASRDVLRIRLGSLDTPFVKQGKVHTFVSEKAPWDVIPEGVPQFPEWAPKSVLHQRGSRQDEQ